MEKNDFNMENYRHYIDLLQENINRMAANSANCKTWLVSIVSALFVVQAAIKDITCIFLIAILPIVLFYLLDSYYLGLEKRFIKLETKLIEHIKMKREEDYEDMYNLNPQTVENVFNCTWKNDFRYTWKSMKSFSTLPFYGMLLLFVVAVFLYIK